MVTPIHFIYATEQTEQLQEAYLECLRKRGFRTTYTPITELCCCMAQPHLVSKLNDSFGMFFRIKANHIDHTNLPPCLIKINFHVLSGFILVRQAGMAPMLPLYQHSTLKVPPQKPSFLKGSLQQSLFQ